jgi:signal transduction histidine kinase
MVLRGRGGLEVDGTASQIVRAGKSLQRHIVFFSIVIVSATAVLAAALLEAQQQSALDKAKFDASNLSAAFQEEVGQVINHISNAMDRLKGEIEARGAQAALLDWLRHSGSMLLPAHLSVAGADGRIIASTADPGWAAWDASDRDYFRFHADSQKKELYISQPILGRASGRVVVPMSYRLEKADGQFNGVLLATLDPDFLGGLYRNVDLGRTGSVLLLGMDGVVRAYFSRVHDQGKIPTVVGAKRNDIWALRESAFDPEGAYERKSPIDGVVRVYHWRKIKGYPLIVIVGLGKAEALQTANRQSALVIAFGGSVLILAIFMPLMLYREVSRRIANEIGLNEERAKLTEVNEALASERRNLRAINEELNKARQRAEEASEAKSAFLTNMSHEFRTPMHAILNYTSMCLKKDLKQDHGKIRKYIENTRSAGQRLLGLLNGLLDLAKLEEGKIELHTGPVDLMDVVRHTQLELGSLLEEKSLRSMIVVEAQTTIARADPNRITQVIVNLFSNAIKFSPPGGLIKVVVANADLPAGKAGLRCSVCDDGVGIPGDELGQIFDRFIQSSATKKYGGGAGLGLTICRELIALHGGRIWAANRKEGGAMISFIIPADEPANPTKAQQPVDAGSLSDVRAPRLI